MRCRSQVLGAGTVQHALVSRRTLQSVVMNALDAVVVNRANVTHVEAAVIHAGLVEVVNRRRTLHLTTEVRRTLMHVLGTTEVLGTSPKTPDVSTSETAAAAHVSTASMATAAATPTVAVTGRQVLKTEQ